MKPLRGRVVIREHEPKQIGSIIVPDQAHQNERDYQHSQGLNAMSSHRATVLAIGAPMLTSTGVEVPHGFGVGDEVVFVWHHNEQMNRQTWHDGKPCNWVTQSEVIAVIDRGDGQVRGWSRYA